MANTCLFSPVDKNGKSYKALSEYKAAFGPSTGTKAFLKALSPAFHERHKGKLSIDSQGVATLESAVKMPDMKELIGFESIRNRLEKNYRFTEVEDTADNFRMLVNQAKTFNDQNEEYVAYVENTKGKLRNVVHKKDSNTVKKFNDQYGSLVLNDKLVKIFGHLGLTVSDLNDAEKGYSGVVDFSRARAVAGEFSDLIQVANNMKGQMSMSEEFSHLIVRMLKDRPLIQRTLSAIAADNTQMKNILGDDYQLYVDNNLDEDGNTDYNTVAEECVGRLLQRILLDNAILDKQDENYLEKLWKRTYNFIKNLFKDFDYKEVDNAVIDADQTIDSLAKGLLAGDVTFTEKDIESTYQKSNARMYHLEKGIEYLKTIVEDALVVETKKLRIIKNEKAVERAKKKMDSLTAILNDTPEGRLKGIINYADAAIKDLGAARVSLLDYKPEEKDFTRLRGIRSTIQSYNEFINQLAELVNSKDEELSKLLQETSIEDKNHVVKTLKEVYDDLQSLNSLVKTRFKDVTFLAIEEFFKAFFDVNGKFSDGSNDGRTLGNIIKESAGDIGFFDRYLMTMSSSGDLLLQLFDEVVKKAKAFARYDTIDDIKSITRIMLRAEDMGITSFDWIYEKDNEGHKTGNYISGVNLGQYEKDRKEFLEKLDEEYGINPTGEKAKEKKRVRRQWFEEHGKGKPNNMYRNNDFYTKLTEDQKKILTDIIQLKQKFDKRLPAGKVSTYKAIQMRRTSQQRFLDSVTNPTQIFQNIKESIAKEFTKSSDDNDLYGEKSGLMSFDNTEFKILPALYTTRLSNPDEITSDVFSALAAYSYSTNIYKQMDSVVDPLEVAKGWISDPTNRKIAEMSNGKMLKEKIGKFSSQIIKTSGSNIVDKLEDFMDSQVYLRYYADSDKTINVLGREIKGGKIIDKLLSLGSSVQLGFNALSQLGNLATGISMQNIEAFSRHYFGPGELLKADKEYLAALRTFLPEVESKNPTNKLALFDQLFDIKQEFEGNTKRRMNTVFEKVFGKTIAFLGQTCGDHWLYNRTALAMCIRKKVKLNSTGETVSLWEALKVQNVYKGEDRIKELVIDAVDAETGETVDLEYIRRYSEKINEINHRLFGVYNTDDMVAAQRVALGRCVLQYRQWIVPMFARRFQSRRWVTALDEYEEGYYITALHLLAGLKNGLSGIPKVWNELDEGQRRNCYRALTEMIQFGLVWAIANFCTFGKGDPDRGWGMKLAEYMAQRELHELGNLAPSFTMGNEIMKTVKSPASLLNTTQAGLNLFASLLDPRDWTDEIESGKYEGMSTLQKNFLKAPFPILAPFNQLDRFIDNIEEVTRYYARSY